MRIVFRQIDNINKEIEIIFNEQQSSVNISFGLVPTKEFTWFTYYDIHFIMLIWNWTHKTPRYACRKENKEI